MSLLPFLKPMETSTEGSWERSRDQEAGHMWLQSLSARFTLSVSSACSGWVWMTGQESFGLSAVQTAECAALCLHICHWATVALCLVCTLHLIQFSFIYFYKTTRLSKMTWHTGSVWQHRHAWCTWDWMLSLCAYTCTHMHAHARTTHAHARTRIHAHTHGPFLLRGKCPLLDHALDSTFLLPLFLLTTLHYMSFSWRFYPKRLTVN